MGRFSRVLMLILACWLFPARGEEPPRSPFQDVPRIHWAYDAVQQLAQRGYFTGYPDGTFVGKKALTRYEFAVAIQRLSQDVQRSRDVEGAGIDRGDATVLLGVVQEFSDELAMLGADVKVLKQRLNSLTYPWREEPPDLAVATPAAYPGVGVPDDPGYVHGERLAAAEWQRGEVVFYTTAFAKPGGSSPSTRVRYRAIGPARDDPYTLSLIAGHNAALRRLIARFGLPRVAVGHAGTAEPSKGTGPFSNPRHRLRVSLAQPEACSRDGRVLLRLEELGPRREVVLRVTLPDRTLFLPLSDVRTGMDSVDIAIQQDPERLLIAVPRGKRSPSGEVHLRVLNLSNGSLTGGETRGREELGLVD